MAEIEENAQPGKTVATAGEQKSNNESSQNTTKVNTKEQEIDSETEDDGQLDSDEDSANPLQPNLQAIDEQLQTTNKGQIIDDENPDVIEADIDLTADIPLDTDYIELIHLKIISLRDLDLGRFRNAESICLRQNLIESISDVKHYNAEKLVELDLYDNRISHISSHVNGLINLKSLDLSFNRIKTIKNLDKLIKLEHLYLIQNKISEIQNLSSLQKLKNLELGGNKIPEVSEELLKLPTIEKLWLGKNRITKLQNLMNLKNLKILSIQSNRISKIEGLESCENLEEFYISHNRLTKLEGLTKNTKLTVLDITGNKISKLEGLETLVQLTDLWASSNLLDSFDNIADALKNCKEIDTVYFENNPVHLQNRTSYRRKLKLFLPQSLTKIDATYLH